MDNVEFKEEQSYGVPQSAQTGLTGLVIKWGLAKNQKEAQQVLIIIAVLAAVAAVAIILINTGALKPKPVPVMTPIEDWPESLKQQQGVVQ